LLAVQATLSLAGRMDLLPLVARIRTEAGRCWIGGLMPIVVLLLLCLFVMPAFAAPAKAKKPFDCADLQAVKVPGIPGCSLYSRYREGIFQPDLPQKLNLPDGSERSWAVTVL